MERDILVYEVTENDLKHNSIDNLIGIIDHIRMEGSRYRNSLRILCLAYNDIPDELHTIPKFRRWIRKVVNLRPFLLYYLCFKMENPVHVIGCLGDVETVTAGERVTMKEIEERNLSHFDFPVVTSTIYFDEDIYIKMKTSIAKLCDEVNDPESKKQLLSLLEYHHRD